MKTLSDNTISIILTKAGINAVRTGHPWLYDTGIAKKNKEASSGDIAVLYDDKRVFAGIGLYDAHAPIKVRVLHTGKPVTLDQTWLKDKFAACIEKRKSLADDIQTTGYRLINGENDHIAGVVVDRYEDTLVIKIDSTCWLPHLETIKDILTELIAPERIVLRLSRTVKDFSALEDGAIIYGRNIREPLVFSENGILFYADPEKGQKTGFFLDQRDNRAKVGELAKRLDVLNVFAYTGGFSIYAAKGGAKSVASLDISKPALDACIDNFKLNDINCPHTIICGDAFEEMEKLIKQEMKYGMVIVDPPSFARKQTDVAGAIKAYEKLNRLAVKLLKRGGILVSASCSARVTSEEFFDAVAKAIKSSGRKYQEIKKTGHAKDHQVGFPQGGYLKCLFAKVD